VHPDRSFHSEDRDLAAAIVEEVGFGMVFAATPDGPRVAHVPVVWLGDDAIGLHVSRGNGIARHLDGAKALFTVLGPDGYVSPDWYGEGAQEVPTWNYVSVELEGTMDRMDRDALADLVEALSRDQERRLAPKPEWTLDKFDALRFERMLGAIIGFRLEIAAWRGTRKLGQNKPEAARLSAADALEAHGRRAIAHWMRHPD
jgi:transcriptional regulator